MSTRNNKPVFEIRLGSIRVSVWKNENDRGVWHNTTIIRTYKEGEEWRESSSYSGLADLALVTEGIRLARDYITRSSSHGEGDETSEASSPL